MTSIKGEKDIFYSQQPKKIYLFWHEKSTFINFEVERNLWKVLERQEWKLDFAITRLYIIQDSMLKIYCRCITSLFEALLLDKGAYLILTSSLTRLSNLSSFPPNLNHPVEVIGELYIKAGEDGKVSYRDAYTVWKGKWK